METIKRRVRRIKQTGGNKRRAIMNLRIKWGDYKQDYQTEQEKTADYNLRKNDD